MDSANLCPITKHMPIGAFVVFSISLIAFIYLLIIDNEETQNERTPKESLWIALFFILLIVCMSVSGYCVIKAQKMKIGKKIDKNFDILKDKFYSSTPQFKGNKIF